MASQTGLCTASGRRLASLTDDFVVESATANGYGGCWPGGLLPLPWKYLGGSTVRREHGTRAVLSSRLPPFPGQAPNTEDDGVRNMQDCMNLCDLTKECNFVGFVASSAVSAVGCTGGCYMFGVMVVDASAGESSISATAAYGCPSRSLDHFTGQTDPLPAGGIQEAQRDCPTTDAAGDSTSPFGSIEELTTDIKIAPMDGDAYADLVTVSGRDYVRIYRGTAQTQATGDFSSVVPETVHLGRRRRLSEEPYSRFPSDARGDTSVELANAQQLFVADFDNNGRMDLFLHAPAPSAGSCAQRCHAQGRFGYDSFEILHTLSLIHI